MKNVEVRKNTMNKLTKTQKITIAAFVIYIIWEITVQIWASTLPPSDPVIRADLMLIYPLLILLVIISLIQFFKNRSKK